MIKWEQHRGGRATPSSGKEERARQVLEKKAAARGMAVDGARALHAENASACQMRVAPSYVWYECGAGHSVCVNKGGRQVLAEHPKTPLKHN